MAGIQLPGMQQRDSLGEILKGLQVAATSYGIYKDYKNLEAMKEERDAQIQKAQAETKLKQAEFEEKEKTAKGYLTIPSEAKLKQEGWREATAADKNVVPFFKSGPTGDQQVFFRPPQSQEERLALEAPGKKKDDALKEHEKNMKIALDLRDRYDKDMTTQLTKGRMNAFAAIEENVFKPEHNGATDMSLIFQYMKLLDPVTGVKEGEYASARDTVNIPQKIVNLYNQKVVDGTPLSEKQRNNFYNEAKSLLTAQLKQQELVDKRYEKDTKKFGLSDPSMVIDQTFRDVYDEIKKAKNKPLISNKNATSFSLETEAQAVPGFDIDSYLKRQP